MFVYKSEIKLYNMKKHILLILPLFFILLNSNAQKSSVILRGGLNLANVTISENGRIDDAKTLTSFQAGFIGDVSLGQFFSLQPGLLVTGKGSKTQSGEPTDASYFKATSNPIYLEVPLNLVFKFGANDGPISLPVQVLILLLALQVKIKRKENFSAQPSTVKVILIGAMMILQH